MSHLLLPFLNSIHKQHRPHHQDFQSEVRFHETRRWRFDAACFDCRIAIEIDGGIWTGGRHSRGAGQIKDMEKMNEAALLGWRVFHFSPQQVYNGTMVAFLERLLKQ